MIKSLKRNSISFLLIIVIIFGCTITTAPITSDAAEADGGKEYFVSTTGNDKKSGSKSEPFKTFDKALSVLKPGDTLYIMGGTYYQKLIIKNSGTEAKPITITNYNNERVVISGAKLKPTYIDDNSGLISINNKDYVHINGLEIAYYSTAEPGVEPIGIAIWNGGYGLQIRNCYIRDIVTTDTSDEATANAIRVDGDNPNKAIDGLILDGNEFAYNKTGYSETCVLSGHVTNFTITNNRVHDNNNIGILMAGYYDVLEEYPDKNKAMNGVCSDNVVYNNSSSDNGSYSDACAGGIYIDGGWNITVERNLIYNCDYGIEATSENFGGACENATIRNNVIYNCNFAGISIFGYEEGTGTTNNTKIINNTLYGNETNIYFQEGVIGKNNVIKNNICFGAKYDNFYNEDGISINNNVMSNNLTIDPLFVDVTTGNFRLMDDSPAIDNGVLTGIDPGTLDADKASRVVGASIDIGAYEYQSITPVTPVNDGKTQATAIDLPFNVEVQASLNTSSDSNWYKLTTNEAGTYVIRTMGTSVDTWGELMNSGGDMIASDDDGAGDGNFRISASLAANSVYYIYVDGSSAGNYSIIATKP